VAETYAQRKSAVLRQVRLFRQQLRQVDTQIEKAQREATRLSQRKTLITPQSLDRLIADFEEIIRGVNLTDAALVSLAQIARSYL